MWNNIFGQLGSSAAQQYQNYGSSSGYGMANAGALSQQQQAMLHQQYQQAQMQAFQKPQWVIDGQVVSFQEFTDRLFPEDTPEKTVFLLRYAK